MAPKVVGILLENTYEDLEVWYTLLRLREAGHKVVTIATQQGLTYLSKYKRPCTADVSIDSVTFKDLDCLVIPGGWAPDLMRRDQRFVDLAKDTLVSGKPVAAVCRGPWLLCTAKCLQGRTLTGLPAIRADIENAGGRYLDQEVVVDGNLITSRLPTDLDSFGREIVKILA